MSSGGYKNREINESLTDDGGDTKYLIEGYLQNENRADALFVEEELAPVSENSYNKAIFSEFACFIAEHLVQNTHFEGM